MGNLSHDIGDIVRVDLAETPPWIAKTRQYVMTAEYDGIITKLDGNDARVYFPALECTETFPAHHLLTITPAKGLMSMSMGYSKCMLLSVTDEAFSREREHHDIQ